MKASFQRALSNRGQTPTNVQEGHPGYVHLLPVQNKRFRDPIGSEEVLPLGPTTSL